MTTLPRTRGALLSVAAATRALSACSTTDSAIAPVSNDSPAAQSQTAVEPAADLDDPDDLQDDDADDWDD